MHTSLAPLALCTCLALTACGPAAHEADVDANTSDVSTGGGPLQQVDATPLDGQGGAAGSDATMVARNLKPLTQGIISMGPTPFLKCDYDDIKAKTVINGQVCEGADNSFADLNTKPDIMSAAVVNVLWGDLEPTRGTFTFGPIDDALATLNKYNSRPGAKKVVARLRIWPNAWAPDWAKRIGGAPIPISNGAGMNELTVGRIWTPAYLAAWQELLVAVAAAYEDKDMIADITVTTTSIGTDEPFHVLVDATSTANLKAAGYTDSQQLANYRAMVGDYYTAGFHRTRLELPCATYHEMGAKDPTPSITEGIIDDVRAHYGAQVELGSHALDSVLASTGDDAPIFNYESTKAGPPISYQTQAPGRITNDDWAAVVKEASALGANSLELWDIGAPANSWFGYSTATLLGWDAELRADPLP